MPKKLLTELTIRSFRAPSHGQVTYWDTHLSGFNVRVSQGGAKSFCVVYGARRHRVTIGRSPLIPLAIARKRAREILLAAALSPTKQLSLSYDQAVQRYLRLREGELRPGSFKQHKRLLEVHFPFGASTLDNISTAAVTKILDAISGPSEKAHAYTALKTFFNWCVSRELCPKNPLAHVPKPGIAASRERTLDDDEIRHLWRATEGNTPFDLFVRILLTTAQRANQIASLELDWIDYENRLINFPPEVMKSNQPHTLPLGPLTETLLRKASTSKRYLFTHPNDADLPLSNWNNLKRGSENEHGIVHWTFHDLRRTWATQSAKLGSDPHVIERVLAHTTGSMSKVAAIYNRFKYQEQLREAIVRYENHIVHLCTSMKILTRIEPATRLIRSA